MTSFTRKQQIVILIVSIIVVFTIGYSVLGSNTEQEIIIEGQELLFEIEKDEDEEIENFKSDFKEEEPQEVVIHITGEVNRPGIVVLEDGERVIDAIKKAGGLKPSADESNINLARKLLDEDKVYIPRIGEQIEDTAIENDVSVSSNQSTTSRGSGGKININSASKEELKTLPGIGEVTAQKIIDYRTSSRFNSVEDIMKVSGIGDKKFEAIKELITAR